MFLIRVDYWEEKYACPKMRRKIPLPSTQDNLIMMFNRQEIVELRVLLGQYKHQLGLPVRFLNVDDVDYMLCLN